MNGARDSEMISGAWLATTLGIEPREIDMRRRAGELLGIQAGKGSDHLYPTWQFDAAGRPLAGIARVVGAARRAGLRDEELHELLLRRDGLTGPGRLADALRAGREDRVLEAIRAAAPRR